MTRSFINLRQALFGVSCTIIFGAGATQAFAGPDGPHYCPIMEDQEYYLYWCDAQAQCEPGHGICTTDGTCRCGDLS
jgi:hypothetical protein